MSAPNPATAMARAVVDELVRGGMEHAIVAPGSRSTALAMALHADGRLRLHVQVDERSAGFLALGLARVTGHPVAVVTTSGTATANLHPAVVEADHAAVPLLVLTADRPPEMRQTGANQTIHQPGLYGTSVRWEVDLGVAEDHPAAVRTWRATASRAMAEARGLSGAPGPVHVNLPFREPTVPLTDDGRTAGVAFSHPLDGRDGDAPWTRVDLGPRVPDGAAIAAVAAELAGRRGLVVAGESGADPDPVHRLGEALGWPVLATALSGARDRSGVVGTYHHLLSAPAWAERHVPEAVLRVGRAGPSAALGRLRSRPHVALLPDRRWADPERAATRIVVADPTVACERLAEALGEHAPAPDGWRAAWIAADQRAQDAIDATLEGESSLTEPAVARATAAAVPTSGNLVVGSSMPVRDLDAFMRPRPLVAYGNRGASGIDGFVSTALGVALAGNSPAVALTGDLSLLHDGNGFLLEADVSGPRSGGEPPDLAIVVVNNDGGGIFHFLPQARFPDELERLFATPHGRDLARHAALHDVPHRLAGNRDELVAAIGAGGGVRIVEVRTDRADNVAVHERVTAAVADALS